MNKVYVASVNFPEIKHLEVVNETGKFITLKGLFYEKPDQVDRIAKNSNAYAFADDFETVKAMAAAVLRAKIDEAERELEYRKANLNKMLALVEGEA
jgi:hypothetical protein